MTGEFFQTIISKLDEHFPGNLVCHNEEALQSWYDLLSFYSDVSLALALVKIIQNLKSFPTVAHFHEYITEVTEGTWEEAYDECRRKAYALKYPDRDKDGNPKEPDFKDPLALKTLQFIGVDAFMNCPIDQLNTFRAQFRDMYKSFQKRREIDHYKILGEGGKDSIAMMFVMGRSAELAGLLDKIRINAPDDPKQIGA